MTLLIERLVKSRTSIGVHFFLPLVLPALTLNLFIRAVFIRLWATLRYWRLGLAAFPHNWRETVCVIDARHLPELLPGAGEISGVFSLQGWLGQKIEGNFGDKIFIFLFFTALATIIYLPALLYRWNLKASAWLWGSVALLLSPVLWANDETMRHKTAYWTTWAVQSVLWSAWVTAAKIATPHNPAIIYKPGDGVVSSGLAYVAVRACQAVVC